MYFLFFTWNLQTNSLKGDIEFLVRLNDHAAIALRNAFLYDDLQTAVQSKNEFIGFISHELKNPLTAIKGHADILAKGMVGEINEEQEDFLKTISHNVRRMSTFITDLSDQSHIESKSLRITFASTAVNEVLVEVLQSFAQRIKEKSINIKQNFSPELPDAWCDRLRLIQVLSNLVSNAVKYTPEGGNIEIGAEYAINNWDQEGAAEVVHFWSRMMAMALRKAIRNISLKNSIAAPVTIFSRFLEPDSDYGFQKVWLR